MTNPVTFEHVRRLVERRLVALSEGAHVHTTPTVFFDRIPDRLLKERLGRLRNGQLVREWYLITEEPVSECSEELIGDYGVLVVEVPNLARARRELEVAS